MRPCEDTPRLSLMSSTSHVLRASAVCVLIFGLKTMGRKDASTARTPVDQYRKQIGKQDYKKTRPMLRATRLKAEAKKTALGVKEVALVLAAILVFLLAFYAFFYLNISNEVDLDLDPDEN
ncbi:triple QxxK/R motif-containing protein isoform 4-T4 [Morphnus guianensis]